MYLDDRRFLKLVRECTLVDEYRLRRKWSRLKSCPDETLVQKFWQASEQARSRFLLRRRNRPSIETDSRLPIGKHWAPISEAIKDNSVIVVCGDTGSGKTTQLPQICLQMGRGIKGMIGHTQPRRLAARTVAHRIAQELGVDLGGVVAFKVRFAGGTRDDTLLKVMTDGVLLAELKRDRLLRAYDTIIIDEAHERSLNIDFLLGYLKTILPKRPDLRIIITSATINPVVFSSYFNGAPIIYLSGHAWPTNVDYKDVGLEADLPSAVVGAVDKVLSESSRDVLVFLTGEREIDECASALQRSVGAIDVVKLHGRLDASEQDKAFIVNEECRKIILATNIAETSITLPNIDAVIDAGYVKISRFDARRKVQTLPVELVSKASAEQRRGRCGRIGPGYCLRLYSQETYERLPDFTDPEIARTNLAQTILRLKELKLGEIGTFPFIDSPSPRYVKAGLALLSELEAIDSGGQLTMVGRKLARLPVDPRIAAMLLEAARLKSLREVLVIAAAISLRDPLDLPRQKRTFAVEARRELVGSNSDFILYLNIWAQLLTKRSASELRKFCKQYLLSWRRIREWQDLHRQLVEAVKEVRLVINGKTPPEAAIHRALLKGSLSNFGKSDGSGGYVGAHGMEFRLTSASVLYGKSPQWIMTSDLISTTHLYAHRAARVRANWIVSAAPKTLCRARYANVFYDSKRGTVCAEEILSLYGVRLLSRLVKRYHEINQVEARKVFLAAYVTGKVDNTSTYQRTINRYLQELRVEEAKLRRMDVIIQESELIDLYEARIPPGICTNREYYSWLADKDLQASHPLNISREHLRNSAIPKVESRLFPDVLSIGPNHFKLRYRFDPSHTEDGVSVIFPLVILNQIPHYALDRCVPAWLERKIFSYLKALPKFKRKKLVPMPEIARICFNVASGSDESLTDEVSKLLARNWGVEVGSGDWCEERLENYLLPYIVLVDAHGQRVGGGRSLLELQSRFRQMGTAWFNKARPKHLDQAGITKWDFGELPPYIVFMVEGLTIYGFPGLMDSKTDVALTIFERFEEAKKQTNDGIRRLLTLHLEKVVRKCLRKFDNFNRSELLYTTIGSNHKDTRRLTDVITTRIVSEVVPCDLNDVRSPDRYSSVLKIVEHDAVELVYRLVEPVGVALNIYHQLQARIRNLEVDCPADILIDIRGQIDGLIHDNFLFDHPLEVFGNLPRFLNGIACRLANLKGGWKRDQRKMSNIVRLGPPPTAELRWLVEELRIATFAKNLSADKRITLSYVSGLFAKEKSQI